ncbi:MAG: DUF2809 domain-containing protein [Deltaproteobacteria bacterium]|nr:DUF2809 domain-containing protein [Deltaproteobacteria bacterium]
MTWSSIHTRVIFSLLIITPLGFAFKFYSGPGDWWFNNYGAGVFYEIFWILTAFLFFPSRRGANVIPFYVFAITSMLEFMQLWHPPFLEMIRSSFVGSALIGNTFVWGDFPHYVLGCLIGWGWLRSLLRGEDI